MRLSTATKGTARWRAAWSSPRHRVDRPRPPRAGLRDPCCRQHLPQHQVRGEVLARDLPRRPRVAGIVAPHGGDRLSRLVHGADGEEALAGGQNVLEAGGLEQHRAASGQITGRSVAEPAAAGSGVAALRYTELAERAADVVAILRRAPCHTRRFEQPAAREEPFAIRVFAVYGERELERLAGTLRQSEELLELLHLWAEQPALELEIAVVTPGRDRREAVPRDGTLRRPEVEHDRRECGSPLDPERGERTPRRADVHAHREVEVVLAVDLDRIALGGPEVGVAGIELDEDARPHGLEQRPGPRPVMGGLSDHRVRPGRDPCHRPWFEPGVARAPEVAQGRRVERPPLPHHLGEVADLLFTGRLLEELRED